MRLFAIGDTHLPSTRGKGMDRFGWTNHPEPLRQAWDAMVRPEDVVIVAGDISWASRAHEVLDDLAWLDARPGKKVLLRGNHDNWWGDSSAKLRKLFEPYPSFAGFLQNSAVVAGRWLIAGSRLWTAPGAPPMPGGEMGDEAPSTDYVERETIRLGLSMADAQKKEAAHLGSGGEALTRIVAVHFPPLYAQGEPTAFSRTVEAFGPKVCVYGHLHGPGIPAGFVGERQGVRYVLASCDAAGFAPVLIDG